PGVWTKFSEFLQTELPELPRAVVPDAAASLRSVPKDLAEFRRIREERRARCLAPSYAALTPTAIAHAASPLPGWEATGRGMSWGRVIHQLLEGLMRNPSLDVRAYATNLLAEEERPATDLDEVVTVVEGVRLSALWRRALSARRQLVEVPFALEIDSSEIGRMDGPARTVLQGAIDLAFEEDSGWFIVDYKSDTISDNLEEIVAFYSRQIELYRNYWEKLTGKPTRAGLYFVSTGQEVWPEIV
ncbi:MAG TPA: PD-(D/E)XK nuclease family protein, partial [Thermoanaerobaculia bacterium]